MPSQNLKGKDHKQPASESSIERHERAKKRKRTKEAPTPECSTSIVEEESAAASLLALSQGSPFKKHTGIYICYNGLIFFPNVLSHERKSK